MARIFGLGGDGLGWVNALRVNGGRGIGVIGEFFS